MHRLLIKLILIISISNAAIGQTPIITIPLPATLTPNVITGNQTGQPNFIPNYNQTNGLTTTQINNNAIMQEVEYYEKLKEEQNKLINDAVNESNNNSISYSLPSFSKYPETESYRQAFSTLTNMLSGKEPMNLKKAVFTVENAFFNNQMDYKEFENQIQECVKFSKLAMQIKGYKPENQLAANWILYQFMSDTIALKMYEKTIVHTPMKYDFDDYEGNQDWTKMFVTKLLKTKSGQCHSLPLLYLILCNEFGTKAYLSYSPRHSYAKFKDNKGNMYNLELTNGQIVSDGFIIGSGFVKADAVKNKIYMDTLGLRKQIAGCIVDLAQGFYHKFGYDDFMLQCADTALKYNPASIFALQTKADYYTILSHHVGKQLPKVKSLAELEKLHIQHPKAKEIIDKRNQMYEMIDRLGYQDMPAEVYQTWLQSVKSEKYKQENNKKILFIQNTIK